MEKGERKAVLLSHVFAQVSQRGFLCRFALVTSDLIKARYITPQVKATLQRPSLALPPPQWKPFNTITLGSGASQSDVCVLAVCVLVDQAVLVFLDSSLDRRSGSTGTAAVLLSNVCGENLFRFGSGSITVSPPPPLICVGTASPWVMSCSF